MSVNRKEKEQLYIRRMTELQTRYGNPVPKFDEWELEKLTDEQLDKNMAATVGHLRFEKVWDGAALILKVAVIAFVTLGVIGLLLFGIRQLATFV